MSAHGQPQSAWVGSGQSAGHHRGFYEEWLDRHHRKTRRPTDIYSVPDSSPPASTEDCPFEYVEEEANENVETQSDHGINEILPESAVWHAGTQREALVNDAVDLQGSRTSRDTRNDYVIFEKHMRKSDQNWDKQHAYNEEIQASVKAMAEECDDIQACKEALSQLRDEVASLKNHLNWQGLAGEGTEGRKKSRTRR